jgi:hypothetical protein
VRPPPGGVRAGPCRARTGWPPLRWLPGLPPGFRQARPHRGSPGPG